MNKVYSYHFLRPEDEGHEETVLFHLERFSREQILDFIEKAKNKIKESDSLQVYLNRKRDRTTQSTVLFQLQHFQIRYVKAEIIKVLTDDFGFSLKNPFLEEGDYFRNSFNWEVKFNSPEQLKQIQVAQEIFDNEGKQQEQERLQKNLAAIKKQLEEMGVSPETTLDSCD